MAVVSLKDRVIKSGAAGEVVFPAEIEALLRNQATPDNPQLGPAGTETGTANLLFRDRLLGFFDLALADLGPAVPYRLVSTLGPPASFHLDLELSKVTPAKSIFEFRDRTAQPLLVAAAVQQDGDQVSLQPLPDPKVRILGADVTLRVRGEAGLTAGLSLKPFAGDTEGIIELQLDPPIVLFGATGFGLDLSNGFLIDDSITAAPPPLANNGPDPASDPAWRGIAIRKARLFVPKSLPFLGGQAVDVHLELGQPAGIEGRIAMTIPSTPRRPAISAIIECIDPAARSMGELLPTLIELSMELPIDGFEAAAVLPFRFASGRPLTARGRFARRPGSDPTEMTVSFSLESQGAEGILKADVTGGNVGARVLIAAACLGTALIAEKRLQNSQATDPLAAALDVLLTAVGGAATFLSTEEGGVVVHRVELESEGKGIPAGGKVRFAVDYSVAASVKRFGGAFHAGITLGRPMRIRVRDVILEIDPNKSGVEMVSLGFSKAVLELEDPGDWFVETPGSLLEIVGVRNGRGSLCLDIDLRCKLDLGPIKVSGGTIRVTIDDNGNANGELRGLDVGLSIPGVIEATGKLELTNPNGFSTHLAAGIVPLNVRGSADLEISGSLFKLAIGVDLPGPLPLANSGLGLFGVGGGFAINARPKTPAPGQDPVEYQLQWTFEGNQFEELRGALMFGLKAVVGTLPDLGFVFSARAAIIIGVPDFSIRAGLDGRVVSQRIAIDQDPQADVGASYRGLLVIHSGSDAAVTMALRGRYKIPLLLDIDIPVAALFPVPHPDDFFIHIGSDGVLDAVPPRPPGPVQARILPDFLDIGAWAYLMIHGNRLSNWHGSGRDAEGFVLAVGMGIHETLGAVPIAWAEIIAEVHLLFATNPVQLLGSGRLGGSLHLGPFSLGVDSSLDFMLIEGQAPYARLRVCGKIDLFLTSIEGCVAIEIGPSQPKLEVPPPPHPLQETLLVDDRYVLLAVMADTAAAAPVVWPDAIPLLEFAVAPIDAVGAGAFAHSLGREGRTKSQSGTHDLAYSFTLTGLQLVDVTDGVETILPGPFASAWQTPKSTLVAESSTGAIELALLTLKGELWVDRLLDGGAGLANDPLGQTAGVCTRQVAALPGWALGASADADGPMWHVPPEPAPVSVLQSRVEALINLTYQRDDEGFGPMDPPRSPQTAARP